MLRGVTPPVISRKISKITEICGAFLKLNVGNYAVMGTGCDLKAGSLGWATVLAASLAACGPQKATLTVAGAASLETALTDIETIYEQRYPDVDVVYSWGGSGALQQQISRGAPVDVLIAAGQLPVDRLAAQGQVAERRVLLTNQLVAISPRAAPLTRLDDLAQVDYLAIGQVQTVPAGQYAQEALRSLNLLATVADKLVYTNSVRGVLTVVANGHADAGIVYATDAQLSDRVQVIDAIPALAHSPIRYEGAIVSSTSDRQAAQHYLDFLQRSPAQAIFQRYGFVIP